MALQASPGFSIQPAEFADIPVFARISDESFETDSNTEVKGHGRVPFNMKKDALERLPTYLAHPRLRALKALEDETGEIMGFCVWGFRGIDAPGTVPLQPPPRTESTVEREGTEVNPAASQLKAASPVTAKEKQPTPDPDGIARLEALTDADMRAWMDTVMPDGVRCLFVASLSVSPRFQRRGVASALLKWGTDIVDGALEETTDSEGGAFAWVHSSEGAWRAYEKAGFRVTRTLDIDLDEYAPVAAPPDRYDGGKWGRYVFRYMIYGRPPPSLNLERA